MCYILDVDVTCKALHFKEYSCTNYILETETDSLSDLSAFMI